MTKVRLLFLLLLFFLAILPGVAQSSYPVTLNVIDKEAAVLSGIYPVPASFSNRDECLAFVNKLPANLHLLGYVTASLDTVLLDSTSAHLSLFLGERYQWGNLSTKDIDPSLLQTIGWQDHFLTDKPMDGAIKSWQDKMLVYLEDNGYPFAKIYIDSLQVESGKASAVLKIDKGPLYTIDSIRITGNAKIATGFLERFLDIRAGSIYSKTKLLNVSRRLRELMYIEEEYPPKLIWLNSGSILDLYLKPKKSSQVNVLVGFLPNSDQSSSRSLVVTGEANLNLKNALGSGETIGLNWQQLQLRSPRLNLLYQHPYLFNSPVGLDFSFNMFKKDSTFLNVNFQIGAQYILNMNQSGKLFLEQFQTIVNGINRNFILQNYRLADEADVGTTNVGIDYEYNNTNYRFNPVSGNELRVITSAGIKKIKKNNEVLELKDPGNPGFDFGGLYDTLKLKTYQFKLRLAAAKYFPVGGQGRSTLKAAINGGWLQSENIFRNELFQIGGYKLLRGFDEESQYLSRFAIGTIEYRYLVGQNSYFFSFLDGGWGATKSQNVNADYTYWGTGVGLSFETKVGIFNMAWAIGKRNDVEFNLRQSKIHFGFVNFF